MSIQRFKLDRQEFARVMESMIREARSARRKGCAAQALLVVAGLFSGLLFFAIGLRDTVFVLGGLGLVGGIVGAMTVSARINRPAKRLQKHAGFTQKLGQLLLHEAVPDANLRVYLDIEDALAVRKLYKRGRSTYGHTKTYYKDKWLKLKIRLADGTRVVVARRNKVKLKKGRVQKDWRRMDLYVRPNPQRYRPLQVDEQAGLTSAIIAGIQRQFHDPIEDFHCKLKEDDASTLHIKVTQHNTIIMPREVMVILYVCIEFLDQHCLLHPAHEDSSGPLLEPSKPVAW